MQILAVNISIRVSHFYTTNNRITLNHVAALKIIFSHIFLVQLLKYSSIWKIRKGLSQDSIFLTSLITSILSACNNCTSSMILPSLKSTWDRIAYKAATYYLRDRFEPFCPEVELAGAVVLAPVLAWLLTRSLLLGFVSDSPGGSFRFSVKTQS